MLKDKSISRRNKMFWHTAKVDPMFNTIRVISRHQDTHIYGAIFPDVLTNQEMFDSKAYKEYYAVASGREIPKAKTMYTKKADEPVTPSKSKSAPAAKGTRLKTPAKVTQSSKKRQSAYVPKAKGIAILSEVALTEGKQIKLATKRSKKHFHMSHASGSESEEESWTFSQNDEDDVEESNVNDDRREKEKADNDEVSSDKRVYSPPDYELIEEEENKEGDDEDMKGEQEQDKEYDMYRDVNINLERSDAEMTNAQANQTREKLMMKEAMDVAVQLQTNKLREESQAENQEFLNQVDSTMTTIIKEQVQDQVSKIMPKIKKYVIESIGPKVLVRSTNQPQISYTVAALLLEFELKKILIEKMKENQSVNRSDIYKNLYNALVESYSCDKDIFSSYGDVVTLKRGKEAESSKELTYKESKSTSSSKDASRSQPKSSSKYAHAEEHGQKVDDLEDQSQQEFNIGNDNETYVREALDVDESQWNPSSSPTPDHEWHKTNIVNNRPPQPWITQIA
nr:hypothetical protein [Tanacetum cinerariifolium]